MSPMPVPSSKNFLLIFLLIGENNTIKPRMMQLLHTSIAQFWNMVTNMVKPPRRVADKRLDVLVLPDRRTVSPHPVVRRRRTLRLTSSDS
ncbi:hypothetical protein KEM55_004842 [Ascosphaera atra]|nr:hypothetical protein KEM55_004842 [Ascosphaera atra]